MTTLVPFLPSAQILPPFQTVFTLDNKPVTAVVTWNLAGQRWYLTLSDSQGNALWAGPLIGSPATFNIYLAPGIFVTSTLLYRDGTGNFEVTP